MILLFYILGNGNGNGNVKPILQMAVDYEENEIYVLSFKSIYVVNLNTGDIERIITQQQPIKSMTIDVINR